MKKHCNCEVRSFDVGHYPAHIAVFSNKAYQPIIIQVQVLKLFSYILSMTLIKLTSLLLNLIFQLLVNNIRYVRFFVIDYSGRIWIRYLD